MSHDAVRAAVQQYVDGCRSADAELVRDAFADDAMMWGYLGDDYVCMSGADFAASVVASASPAGPEYVSEIHSIHFVGDIAQATLDEWQFLGANFRNHFGLVKRDGTWRIVSKVFTTR